MTESREETARRGRTLASEADSSGYRRPLPNRGEPAFSTKAGAASANAGPAGGASTPHRLDGGMDRALPRSHGRWLPDWPLAVKTILFFWLFYLVQATLRGVIVAYEGQMEMLERRVFVVIAGMLLTGIMYVLLRPTSESPVRTKIIAAAILCLPAAAAFSAFNHYMFYVYSPMDAVWIVRDTAMMSDREKSTVAMLADGAFSWYFFFAAWSAIYVALSYSRQLRIADQRASCLAREAQDAQLRALRYQINPHFLFNTLNSLSSLVLAERTETAEKMLMNLSAFLRSTLAADPAADVSLAEEIELQKLYLEIEQIRFPDRLKVEVDAPEALMDRRVPVLILQPIVENAVKYGVARSRHPVTIQLTAYEEAGRLHIKVKDDGGDAAEIAPGGGTGVGLANVCNRLTARFGAGAGCLHGADPGGGYTVHIFMPVVSDD